jgi:hypothetical protein
MTSPRHPPEGSGPTPGPLAPWAWLNAWRNKGTGRIHAVRLAARDTGETILETSRYDAADIIVSRPDAHLIAASPLLREACEAALRYDAAIQRAARHGKSWVSGGPGTDDPDLDALYIDWLTKARAALRAAEGKGE